MARALEKWYFHAAAKVLNFLPQKIPTLYTGAGSIKFLPAELASRKVSKPLIITDRTLMANGVVGRVAKVLDLSRMGYAIFDGVVKEPTFALCADAVALLKDEACDSVVAVGGGWVTDSAKIVRMGATHSKPLVKFAGRFKCGNEGLPFICVPAAAGTGSEATSFAIVMDAAKRKELLVSDPKLPADIAILDPEITVEVSAFDTAIAGLHALTHAFEAYTNTLHYSDVDAQSMEAVRLVFGNLRAAYADGLDLNAREALLRAAHLAGRASARGCVGYVHALAHRFGELYDVQRGVSIGILLPKFARLYAKICPERLEELDRVSRSGGGAKEISAARSTKRDNESAMAFADSVAALAKELGMPEKAKFMRQSDIAAIAKAAAADVRRAPYPVPAVFSEKELREILESVAP